MTEKKEFDMKSKIEEIRKKYPCSIIKKILTCFDTHYTYEGNKIMIQNVITDLKKGDKIKLFFDVRSGVAKEIRAPVWYCMATNSSYEEIITLKNEQLHRNYWTDAIDCETFNLKPKQAKVIEADIVRLFPTGYEEVFRHEDIRKRMRRIKRMYEYRYSKPGYFQGMGDIMSIFFIIFCEYFFF